MRLLPVLLAVLSPLPASGGSSLLLRPGRQSVSVTDPLLPDAQSWRVEFQLHGWILPTQSDYSGALWELSGTGAEAEILFNGMIRFQDKRDSNSASVCDLSLARRTNVLVRLQRDTAKRRFVCEIWNSDGAGHDENSSVIQSFVRWSGEGGRIGGPHSWASLGFLRVIGSTVPPGSRPPTTAGAAGALSHWKFDRDTRDSSGRNHHIDFPGAAFVPTAGQVPAPSARTADAPSWSDWISQRAGFPATLDGSHSFSLADQSDTVTCRWQQTAGPTTLRWSDNSAVQPVITGLIFGTYTVRLQVTDASGQSSSVDLSFGAVATDDNGVVVQANPAADVIFGPMIALGRNPWPWADEKALHAAEVRKGHIDAISPPGWGTNLAGTISYTAALASQPAQTKLAAAMNASDTSLTLVDPAALDLSAVPMVVMVHSPSSWIGEEVRICNVAGNVLSVCYDGRAWRSATYSHPAGAQDWPAGSTVRQIQTVGTGTGFLRDFCPAGPGEPGPALYSAGSVSIAPGSTTLTGNGTAWDGSLESYRIRIEGTHGGQPFTYFSQAVKILSARSIELGRPWPADADAGKGLSYAILGAPRAMVRGWKRPDGTPGRAAEAISSCESDTRVYHSNPFAVGGGTIQTGQPVAYSTNTWFSEFGPNYYDEVLAHYAGYFRSGYTLFRDNARKIGDYLPTSPDFDEGWIGMMPRRTGATGMAAAAVLDGRTQNWYALRRLAAAAITGPYSGGAVLSSCDSDTRETAYGLSWIALAALFDPVDTGDPNTPGQRSYWKAQLTRALARDERCKGPNNEHPQAVWAGTGAYTMTNGSARVTGTGIPAAQCAFVASGTLEVKNGMQAATGSGFVAGAKIVVQGKRNGSPYLFYSLFSVKSPGSISMASPYDGDSGSYPYQIESDNAWMSFAADSSNHDLINTLYTCKWLDSSNILLDRPWQGVSGVYKAYRAPELGYGQQPFFLGIKTFAMKLASQAATGETAAAYARLAAATARWVMTTGFDPATGGLNYARGFAGCEPKLNPRLNCSYATDPAAKASARTLNAEAQNAMRVAYEADPTPANKAFGDQFYGSQWGKLGGPYADSVYLNALDGDGVWQFKWLGFLFGMGMAHQWPAVRLGGVRPAIPVSPSIAFDLASAPGAASAQITVTRPNGVSTTFACPASPCRVNADARQGAHWFRITYLNAQGAVVGAAAPEILEVRPPK